VARPLVWFCNKVHNYYLLIKNFLNHKLVTIVMQNVCSIESYYLDMNIIHLFVLFRHGCYIHCLHKNVMHTFMLCRHQMLYVYLYCLDTNVMFKQHTISMSKQYELMKNLISHNYYCQIMVQIVSDQWTNPLLPTIIANEMMKKWPDFVKIKFPFE